MVFDITLVAFWMMDKFVHQPKPYLILSVTCNTILSWMIKIWMKRHLVTDSICNTIIPQKSLQGRKNNVGLTFSVGDTKPWFTISIEQQM